MAFQLFLTTERRTTLQPQFTGARAFWLPSTRFHPDSFPPSQTQTINDPSAFLDDTTTDDLSNHGYRRSRAPALVYTAFLLLTLFSHHGVLVSSRWFYFSSRHVSFFFNRRPIISVDIELQTVRFQPTVSNLPSAPEGTSVTSLPPTLYPNFHVGLPSVSGNPLSAPEGTSMTPLPPSHYHTIT